MEVLVSRCAGLDVHKDSIVASVRCVSAPKHREVRTFGTTTSALLEMLSWLESHEVTHVVMEATGVYWKPVWHVLEGSFELVLANAHHVRNVPGRKTDVNDATWLAELLAHGLVRSSFVPPARIQELRDLTRTRKQISREIAQHTLRIQKTLEDANIKLSSVLTDLMGKSGRAMLGAIVQGQTDPEVLADLAVGRARIKRPQLVEALHGRLTAHHRALLKIHVDIIDSLKAAMAEVDAAVGKALEPIASNAEILKTIPGVSDVVAHVILAEIGSDMSRFETAGHLVSWAGFCPRNDESAGKRRSTRLRSGGTWLKATLTTAAWSAIKNRQSYLASQYARIKARRGAKKAIVAVAASMLTAAYHMLRDGTPYRELGPAHYDQRAKAKTITRLVKRLTELGCAVQVQPTAA